jgi:pimeloyl-ACP methyl ester carboxylesterase
MRIALSAGFLLALISEPCLTQPGCPAPSGRLIQVSPNTRLHVIEWGGHGETILFLSGLASSAHAFDDFARLFVDRFRVVGITRRGVPPSDSSTTGYAAAQVTSDIVAVMDSLHIDRAHVVGWSFGGDEAVMLAVREPGRVRSVVLLDSYDNSPEAATFSEVVKLKYPPDSWTALDSASPLALLWKGQRSGAKRPLSHICTVYTFRSDGRLMGFAVSADRLNALTSSFAKLPYSSVRQPVLAFFRVSRAVGDDYWDYATLDSANRTLAQNAFRSESVVYARARNRARAELSNATVIELPGSTHAVFVDRPELVAPAMVAFFERLRRRSASSSKEE